MFKKIPQLLREVRTEMGKVTWPTRDELTSSTTIVLVVSLVLALFIFVVDQILSFVMSRMLA
jgi:preprotein translocase subunit SecE